MKKTLIIILFFLLRLSLWAQISPAIKNSVSQYPKSFSRYEKLADLINKDFTTQEERAAAIYFWIASNIKYDIKAYYSNNPEISFSYRNNEERDAILRKKNQAMAQSTIRSKKGVCQDYATLYKELCTLAGVDCEIISGASKTDLSQIGKPPKQSDHAWNAIRIKNQWHLVDVTWGAGSVDFSNRKFIRGTTDFYFMTKPILFFRNHFPDEKKWLLINKSADDFAQQPLYYISAYSMDIEFIQPHSGIILKEGKSPIHFEVATEASEFAFAFDYEKSATLIRTIPKGDTKYFDIPSPSRKAKYLTIYHNNKGIVSYKMQY